MALSDIQLTVPEETGNKTFDSVDPFAGFLKSTASAATLEMFGHKPSEEVEGYRSQHPWISLAGELASVGGEYGLAMKGLENLPAFSKGLDLLGSGDTLLSGAGRAAATIAPIEATRVAGSALTGGDTGQTAEEGLFDVGLASGFGGLGGILKAGGKASVNPMKKLGLDGDMKDPAQMHLASVKGLIDSGELSAGDLASAKALHADLSDAVLSETLDNKYKYVDDLEAGDAQPINRLFKLSTGPSVNPPEVVRKRFQVGGSDFPDAQGMDEAMSAAGIADKLDSVQYPRMIAFNSRNGAKSVESEIKANLTQIGSGEFLGKEKEGLYVFAKKLVGDVGNADEGDRWTIFKTHDPDKFASNASYSKVVDNRNAWMADKPIAIDPANPRDILDEVQQNYDKMPMQGYYQATSKRSGAAAIDSIASKLGVSGESELGKRLKETIRETFAPAMYEYKNNPRAQYIFSQARAGFQKAESLAHAMTFGDEGLEKSSTIWGKLLKGVDLSGRFGTNAAFAKTIKGLSKEDFSDVIKAWDMQLGGKELDDALGKRIISQGAYDALKKIQPLDDYMTSQTKATQEATGEKAFTEISGHYLLPRTWEGTWRVPIYSDTNKLVYMASGKTKARADKMAEGILADNETKGWYKKDSFTSDSERDFELAQQVRSGSPEFMTAAALRSQLLAKAAKPKSFKVRTDVGGYQTEFTKDELIKKFYDNVLQRQRYLADMSVKKVLGTELAKLGMTDKSTYDSLNRRLNAMAGRQGEVSKAINEFSDKVFAPALGKNSASVIGKTINKTMHHLTLGALNLQHPVMNAMTFVQTVLPRVAFTLHASDSSLRSAYSWLPVIDRTGLVKGSMGFLEPFRIMKQSLAEMGKPSEELKTHFSRALKEGTVDPKFVEEWVGQNSKQALSFKETLKGEQGYSKWLESISNFLPSLSEKLSRGNGFVVGHILGRGLGLEDDALYRFAKEFTEKTMYNYSVADRPRLFTGPLGSVFGQFKNWTMHYLGNMMEYAGEGYNYNNWSPLMWQMGGTTALGGLSATAAMPIGDGLSRLLTDKSMMQNLYARFNGSGDDVTGNATDAVFMGLPMFMGVSLSASASDPASDPSRNAAMMFSFVQANRAMALGKALESGWNNYMVTGDHPVDSQATRDALIQALAPKVITRLAQQTEDDGLRSLNNGGKIIGGLNLAEKLMYDSGFMTKRIAMASKVNEELWRDQDALQNKIRTWGRTWHDAEKLQAYDVLTTINQHATADGVPIDRIIASARALDTKENTPQLNRKYSPSDIMKYSSIGIIGN